MSQVVSEEVRLQGLKELRLLDTPPSESFDRITRMASRLFDLPVAAVSLTDQDRQWFKSRVGVEHWQISRHKAPCAQVTLSQSTLVIPDLLEDPVYRDSSLARSGIRFYAGAPLITRNGLGLGALCVLGTAPRQTSSDERAALTDFAAMVMAQIELQHAVGRVEPVSGLPNRHQLIEDLQDQARDHPNGLRCLILAETVDPTRLIEVQRVLGSQAIDDLIQTSVRLLRAALGHKITIYQVGAAQFAWLAAYPDDDARSRAVLSAGEEVRSFLKVNALPALMRPATGIAPFSLGSLAAEDVLRAAFGAVQDARHGDTLVSIYSEATDHIHRRRFGLVSDFRAALGADDQLSLVYQPRVDLRTGLCVGAEALLRWQHPVLGAVSPGEFIPVVEQTELVGPTTEWVIRAAVWQARSWREHGVRVPISVNVSVANLEQSDFAEQLIAQLRVARLPCDAIEIEVTESALISDGTRVGQRLRALREAGIRVAIDDFGTAYSSLSYLQNLPADIIKIDQSFVRKLSGDGRCVTLVRGMIAMVKSLGLHVVAEGVEDERAYGLLQSMTCDEAQGYLISRPVCPSAFATWFGQYEPLQVSRT